MAYTLQKTQNWISGFIQGQPTSNFTGNEPLMSTATMIQNMCLSAPFAWSWNRAENTSQTTTSGTQDYTIAMTDFGYAEKISLTDANLVAWEVPNVQNTEPLALSTTSARPQVAAVQKQTYGTNITLRFSAIPNAVYTVNLAYQKAPVPFANLSDNWTMPDSMTQVYNTLVLGEMLAFAEDPRSQMYRARGVAGLLSFAEGLSEKDKAVFMDMYLNNGAAVASSQFNRQQGIQARAA